MTNPSELNGIVLNRKPRFFSGNFNQVKIWIVHVAHGSAANAQQVMVPVGAVLIARHRAWMTGLANNAQNSKLLQDAISSGSGNFRYDFAHLFPDVINRGMVQQGKDFKHRASLRGEGYTVFAAYSLHARSVEIRLLLQHTATVFCLQ